MTESQPLLPTSEQGSAPTRRERVAEFLESRTLHKFVITLIAIDACCVLADLSYTFLNDSCSPPEDPEWLATLSHVSLGITTLFLLEIPMTLWSLGTRFYDPFQGVPHAGLHLFDALIIVVTFILEAVLRGREQELAGMLIVLRLWRLVKLVGGVSVGVGEIDERDAVRAAELEEELAVLKKENAGLRARLQAPAA